MLTKVREVLKIELVPIDLLRIIKDSGQFRVYQKPLRFWQVYKLTT